jgi:PAS domain S-box-containing protein
MEEAGIATPPLILALDALGQLIAEVEGREGRAAQDGEILSPGAPLGVRVLERAAFGVALHRDGRVRYTNAHAAALLGLPLRSTLIGRSVLDFIHPDSRQAVAEDLVDRSLDEEPAEAASVTLIDRHGRKVQVLHTSLVVPHAGSVWVLSLLQDAGLLLDAKDTLRHRETSRSGLVDSAYDLMVEIDPEGRPVQYSASHRNLLGYLPEEMEQLTPIALVHPADKDHVLAQFQSGLSGDPTKPVRYRLRNVDGAYLWFEGTASAVEGPSGERHVVLIARDITEQKRYADELEQAVAARTKELQDANGRLMELQSRLTHSEQLSLTEDLAGAVAHSIRNPLTALLGTIEMAAELTPTPDPVLDRILDLTKRIRSVVDSTLQLFRQGQMDLSSESPGAILDTVRDELADRAAEAGIRIVLEVEEDLPPIPADRSLLVSALVSIGENAIDAMRSGGQLGLEARSIPRANVVRFAISDSGPGIPLELRDKVLEPFFTTKRAGTGLGLAIAKGVVQGHSGSLAIEDRPGGGTTVRIDLPTESEAEAD